MRCSSLLILFIVFSMMNMADAKSKKVKSSTVSHKNKVDYSVLEKDEIPPSKFDENGFYTKSLTELNATLKNHSNQYGLSSGYVCAGVPPLFYGHVYGVSSNSLFVAPDEQIEVELLTMVTCEKGKRFTTVNEDKEGYYKVTGVIEIVDRTAIPNRCTAKVIELYDAVKRDSKFTAPILPTSIAPENAATAMTGDVFGIMPPNSSIAGEGDRVCVTFRNANAPKPGSVVYFYETKDPTNAEKELSAHILAKGMLIHAQGQYATAVILESKKDKPVSKKTIVTTRF